ncbi:MAG: hypothetical protein MUO26_04375 [Methanotrichaceae archaeon]|nr:hypothetical protein [Methanotrichaceae archaeon]
MIRAKLTFVGDNVEKLAKAVEPDNLPEMRLQIAEGHMSLEFCVDRIGTLLSTADDFLMNLKVAEETLLATEDI